VANPVSYLTTANKVVWGKTLIEVNLLSRILLRIRPKPKAKSKKMSPTDPVEEEEKAEAKVQAEPRSEKEEENLGNAYDWVEVFFPSQNIDFPFYLKRLLDLFSFFFLPLFSMLHLLRTRGFWWYLRRKSLLQKLLFNWLQYTGGGCIFRDGVMHANMAKPWLWR
jgi:hypothetical protein